MKRNKNRKCLIYMKRFLSVALFLSLVITIPVQVYAASTDVMQEELKFHNGYEYQITPSDSEWAELSYSEQLKACDMPLDMLSDCSTEELADLVLEYPFLIDILAFNNTDLAIEHLINTSNICEEFFSRDNITDILLDKYDRMDVDYDELLNMSNVTAFTDSGYVAELFLQTYFAHAIHSLTDTQVTELSKIVGEKYEAKKGICDDFATSLLIYDLVQSQNGAIPQYLVPESIKFELVSNGNLLTMSEMEADSNQGRATSGFISSNRRVQLTNGGTYTVGTYTRYGETADCYKYFSGDYSTTEASRVNDSFDNAHTSWSRVATCTRKYNCHSYTWISSSTSNVYWLNNPDAFADSDEFTFVGHGYNTSMSSGDKIIISSATSSDDGFGNLTYSIHSANVLSASGSTKSKLGVFGVYIIPINDLMTFYSGFYYNIYR